MTYLFVTLFLALISYIVYFNVFRAKTIVNSPYNVRQDAFADRIIRGSITDRDGEVLAETQVGEGGTENRVYPYGAAFAHVVGYSNETAGKSGLESIENSELLTSNAFFAEKSDYFLLADASVLKIEEVCGRNYIGCGASAGGIQCIGRKSGRDHGYGGQHRKNSCHGVRTVL